MPFFFFGNNSEHDKSEAIERLIEQSSPRPEFFLMVVLSVIMATLGLLVDSMTVVIGSMLIAPVLYPLLTFSMGIVMLDYKIFFQTLYTIIKSLLFAIISSVVVTYIFSYYDPYDPTLILEILASTKLSFAHFAIAVVAGFAASFALIKPHLNETLPGVAVSVALVSPIATVGIGLARFDWFIASNALILLVMNILGIIFSSFLVFSFMNFYRKRHVAKKAIKKEESQD